MSYVQGSYTDSKHFENLDKTIRKLPKGDQANRVFYLALPPTVFTSVTKNIHDKCMSHRYLRLIHKNQL